MNINTQSFTSTRLIDEAALFMNYRFVRFQMLPIAWESTAVGFVLVGFIQSTTDAAVEPTGALDISQCDPMIAFNSRSMVNAGPVLNLSREDMSGSLNWYKTGGLTGSEFETQGFICLRSADASQTISFRIEYDVEFQMPIDPIVYSRELASRLKPLPLEADEEEDVVTVCCAPVALGSECKCITPHHR
jgi:hypothetical protein